MAVREVPDSHDCYCFDPPFHYIPVWVHGSASTTAVCGTPEMLSTQRLPDSRRIPSCETDSGIRAAVGYSRMKKGDESCDGRAGEKVPMLKIAAEFLRKRLREVV